MGVIWVISGLKNGVIYGSIRVLYGSCAGILYRNGKENMENEMEAGFT